MELTRQEAIERHRAVWNWIADNVKSGKLNIRAIPVSLIKQKALSSLYPEDTDLILDDCYLCEYAQRQYQYYLTDNHITFIHDGVYKRCHFCPLGNCESSGPNNCLGGLYWTIYNATSNETNFEEIAREIATLPEANFSGD